MKVSNGLMNIWVMEVGPPRFELESIAPQATRIPSYPTGPYEKKV